MLGRSGTSNHTKQQTQADNELSPTPRATKRAQRKHKRGGARAKQLPPSAASKVQVGQARLLAKQSGAKHWNSHDISMHQATRGRDAYPKTQVIRCPRTDNLSFRITEIRELEFLDWRLIRSCPRHNMDPANPGASCGDSTKHERLYLSDAGIRNTPLRRHTSGNLRLRIFEHLWRNLYNPKTYAFGV
jgi:hypothetical protein